MRKIKKIGLKAEFNLMLLLFLSIMIVSQSILVVYTERNISEQRRISRDVITRQINSFLTTKLETLNKIKYEVQSDPMVAEILEQRDAADQGKLIARYAERMYEIQNYFSDIFYVVICDDSGKCSKLTPNMSASEYESLKTAMAEYTATDEIRDVALFDISSNAYSDYRYFFINIPVSRYDFSLCRDVRVGEAAICMKVNMRDAFSSDRFSGQYENINLSIKANGKEINLINSKGSKQSEDFRGNRYH